MFAALILALLGCPTETPADATDAVSTPASPDAPPDGVQAPPAQPADPNAAGGATAPPPADGGTGGQPPPGGGPPAAFSFTPGEGVTVSGKASFKGDPNGTIRMDVLKKTEAMPELIHSAKLDKLGDFSVELPKSIGTVQVTVFIDAGSDGPSPGEPMAASAWIDIGTEPVKGLDLVLTALDPSKPPPTPPGGSAAPPAPAAPGSAAPTPAPPG